MNKVARIVGESDQAGHLSVDLEALRAAPVARSPFPYLVVPGFVRLNALDAISADFPAIAHHGSFPLQSLRYGPAFARFIADLETPEMTRVVGGKLGLDLTSSPTMVTVRGQSREAAGKIHTASRTKHVTALIFMNESGESPRGRSPPVRSATALTHINAEGRPSCSTRLSLR